MGSPVSPLVQGMLQGAAIAQRIKQEERAARVEEANARLTEANFRLKVFQAGGHELSPADQQGLAIGEGPDRVITGPTGRRFALPSDKQRAAAAAAKQRSEEQVRTEGARARATIVKPVTPIQQAGEDRAARKAKSERRETRRTQQIRDDVGSLLDAAGGDVAAAKANIPRGQRNRLGVRRMFNTLIKEQRANQPRKLTASQSLAQKRVERERLDREEADQVTAQVGQALDAAGGDARKAIQDLNRRARRDPELAARRVPVRAKLLKLRKDRVSNQGAADVGGIQRLLRDVEGKASTTADQPPITDTDVERLGIDPENTFEAYKRLRLAADGK